MKKVRLDEYLIRKGVVKDIKEATGVILSGRVRGGDQVLDKPGMLVKPEVEISLQENPGYVSRGALKLKKAFELFSIDFREKIVMDIGCSTGGFTDFALKHGAKKVFAIDVGKGVLDYNLRNDDRVIVMEGVNFRYLPFDDVGCYPDIILGDLSFISLKTIFDPLLKFCKDGTEVVFLIKPQFEANPKEVEKGGLVKDNNVHKRVIFEVISKYCENFEFCGLTSSPIKGAKGNVEYLVFLVYKSNVVHRDDIQKIIDKVVDEEYSYCCKTSC